MNNNPSANAHVIWVYPSKKLPSNLLAMDTTLAYSQGQTPADGRGYLVSATLFNASGANDSGKTPS